MEGKKLKKSTLWGGLGFCLSFVVLLTSGALAATPSVFDDPNPQAGGAHFGAAIASVGPVGTCPAALLVGAPMENGEQGRAYLVCGPTGALLLTLEDKLTPQAGAHFGFSVVSAGDVDNDGVTDLLIGAPGQCGGTGCTGSNGNVGRAFVFSGVDGHLVRTLDPSGEVVGGLFGSAVASGGGKLIVGAPGQNVAIHVHGQVFVFNADGSLAKTIIDPDGFDIDTEVGFNFGSAVASVGADILVGNAQMDVSGSVDQGRVYIFSGSGTGTDGTPLLTINHPEPQAGAFFGASAASVGTNILIGAPRQNVAGTTAQGRAYLFDATGTKLLTLDLPDPAPLPYTASANFGFAVAGGDFTGDGTPDLLIGAPNQTVGRHFGQGQAFVFSGVDGSLLITLNNPPDQAGARFGAAVAFADIDGDGRPDPIIGAPLQDVAFFDQGQVFAPALSGAVNHPPVANAGPDQTVNENSFANLDGTGSSDPDGDPLTFLWTQIVGPSVTLFIPTSSTPTFTTPQVSVTTVLTFQLVVNDGKVNSSPSTVNITVLHINQPPIANAGPDQTVNVGNLVTLNGTGSSDPDGDPITFLWTQVAGPTVRLSNARVATPTFTAPKVNTSTLLTFQLVVNDGKVDSPSDSVNITVVPIGGGGSGVDLTGTITKLELKETKEGNDKEEDNNELHFTLQVVNIGTQESSGSFTIKFYISDDATLDGFDSLIFVKNIKGGEARIKPGKKISISGNVKIPGPTAGKFLIAVIDSENTIAESNEANNIATRQIP